MDGNTARPIKQSELEAMLQNWDPAGPNGGEKGRSIPPREKAVASVDWNRLMELAELGGEDDPDFLASLISRFHQDASVRLERLDVAVRQHDARTVKEIAHSLKGSSANLGLVALAALCQQLQDQGESGDTKESGQVLEDLRKEYRKARRELEAMEQQTEKTV